MSFLFAVVAPRFSLVASWWIGNCWLAEHPTPASAQKQTLWEQQPEEFAGGKEMRADTSLENSFSERDTSGIFQAASRVVLLETCLIILLVHSLKPWKNKKFFASREGYQVQSVFVEWELCCPWLGRLSVWVENTLKIRTMIEKCLNQDQGKIAQVVLKKKGKILTFSGVINVSSWALSSEGSHFSRNVSLVT